jgi:glycosyltransferase involved in cell wall biosynthesis
MKILLLSRYGRLGASSRIRSYQFLPRLPAGGIEITVAPLLADSYLQSLYVTGQREIGETVSAYLRRLRQITSAKQFDLLWVEYEMFPWLPYWFEKLLSEDAPPYVVDYDDAIYHRYNLHPNPVVRAIYSGKIERVMRGARLVIAGNDYIAQHARDAGAKNVDYLPSVVDTERYQPSSREGNSIFTIGWIGLPVTARFLNVVSSALAEVCNRSSAKVVLVGAGKAAPVSLLAEVRNWSEESEISEIQSFDVGIMPLPDEPFERGKCGYKLIQYMACGLPVVASPVGVNCRIVEHGVNGFLANTPEEWVRAILTLKESPELRRRMGAAGRKKVEREYSLNTAAPKLISLLRSAVENSAVEDARVITREDRICVG